MNSSLLLFVSLLVGMVMGLPVAIAICVSVIIYMFASGLDFFALAQMMVSSADSMTILAVPGFIIAGELMDSGGLSKRIVAFAEVFISKIKGGLAIVNILASMMFGAISGSGAATTLAIGGIMMPEMNKRGYPKAFSAATAASGGILGGIIPPSIGIVLYGAATGVSITAMFKAGFSTGIFMGFLVILYILYCGKKYDLPASDRKYSAREVFEITKSALPALGAPVIILGGIFSGLFTPTEASVISIVYALIVGLFAYRELTAEKIRRVLAKSAESTANIMLIMVFAGLFGFIVSMERVPNMILQALVEFTTNKYMILLLVNVMYLIMGMFMSGLSVIIITAPILAPLAAMMGIDPVHFGIMLVANTNIGQITPPFGGCLFAGIMISGEPVEKIVKYIWGFILVYILSVFIIMLVPAITHVFL